MTVYKWAEMTTKERDALVAEKVMGWVKHLPHEKNPAYVMWFKPGATQEQIEEAWQRKQERDRNDDLFLDSSYVEMPPAYSQYMGRAWEIVEKFATQQGYESDVYWLGPLYKPEHHYMTEEGYPLGSTCWYVKTSKKGRYRYLCAPTAAEAVCLAGLILSDVHVIAPPAPWKRMRDSLADEWDQPEE